MFVHSDFTDLLSLFNDNGVRYLVIGGYAVIQHAEPRFTKDLDLWISTDPGNARSVYQRIPFISRRDLITAKLASGRPQDLIDAELLAQIDSQWE